MVGSAMVHMPRQAMSIKKVRHTIASLMARSSCSARVLLPGHLRRSVSFTILGLAEAGKARTGEASKGEEIEVQPAALVIPYVRCFVL